MRKFLAGIMSLVLLGSPIAATAQQSYTGNKASASGGAATWGTITGTLSGQSDLNTALGLKANLTGGNAFTGSQGITDGGLSLTMTSATALFAMSPGSSTTSEIQLKGASGALSSGLDILAAGGSATFSADTQVVRNAATTTTYGTWSSSGLNMGATSGLSFGGTSTINSSGVLQAHAFPALTGDVTTSSGAVATTIAAGAVSTAKMANLAATTILGNPTGSAAAPSAITLAGGLGFSGTTLTAAGALTPASVAATGALSGTTVTGTGLGTFNGVKNSLDSWTNAAGNVLISQSSGVVTFVAFGSGDFRFNNTSNSSTDAEIDPSGNLSAIGSIKSSAATAGIGYATGAGGAVTQLTSRTTGVTNNKACGAITLFSAAGSATYATFTVTDSAVAATDTIVVNEKSGTNLYIPIITSVGAGTFNLSFATTGGTATDAPVFNYCVIKGVAA